MGWVNRPRDERLGVHPYLFLPGPIYGEADGEILGDPGGEHKDMKELMEAEVFSGWPRTLQGVEDCPN